MKPCFGPFLGPGNGPRSGPLKSYVFHIVLELVGGWGMVGAGFGWDRVDWGRAGWMVTDRNPSGPNGFQEGNNRDPGGP